MSSLAPLRHVAIAAMVFAGSAHAEEVGRWRAPNGEFTLDFASLGWRSLPPLEGQYFRIQSAAMRGRSLECGAGEVKPEPAPPGTTQSLLNEATKQLSQDDVIENFPIANDVHVTHAMIDAVAVVDFDLTLGSFGLYSHWRSFGLLTERGIVYYQIHCGGALPMSPDDIADIDAVLATLQIVSRSKGS